MTVDAHAEARRRNELGCALLQSGRFGEALKEFKEALQLNPKEAAYHRNLGAVLLKIAKRRCEASGSFREAVFRAPDQEKAGYLHELGVCHLELGDTAEAVEAFERAVKAATNTAFETKCRISLTAAIAKAQGENRAIELDAAKAEHPFGKRRSVRRRPL